MSGFRGVEYYAELTEDEGSDYELLPFRFTKLDGDRYVVTNMAGEYQILRRAVIEELVDHRLSPKAPEYVSLRSRHFIADHHSKLGPDFLALKVRTRNERISHWTGLHIFVLTLRCEHACPYCQVSRQSENKSAYDMSEENADKSILLALSSPNQTIKIEFQGGEPFLNFDLMKHVVAKSTEWNAQLPNPKNISFVAATNLAVVTDKMLEFCRKYDISISTSLDGPEELHNKNRPRPGADSYARAISGIRRARQMLGRDRVSALMTTTALSLPFVREIIDEYLRQDLPGVFLRPLSPYGFAVKTKAIRAYNASQWLKFYDDGLDYIINLNRHGIDFREYYASTVATKMFKDEDPGYVDLTSPAGIGTGAVVYNYDGSVYASDEARMLAEMGDETFKLGSVSDSFEKIFTDEIFLTALDESFAYSSPICNDCAFEPWCGADPVFHWGQQHDFCGKKWDSEFCSRNMHIFRSLVARMESDTFVKKLFRKWAS